MKLKDFVDKINYYADDIGCMKDGYIGSHKIIAELIVEDTKGNRYNVSDIELNYLGGCGCSSDITLIIEKMDDD